jgi:hypothetical protein
MFHRAMEALRGRAWSVEIHWLSPNIAIGRVGRGDAWRALHARGIRAIVYLGDENGDVGAAAREHGMRYLRFGLQGAPRPRAGDLQIIAAWVQERIAADGPVFIQDSRAQFNDALVAVSALVRGGLPAHLALLALRRTARGRSLDSEQHAELVRFAIAQEMDRPPPSPSDLARPKGQPAVPSDPGR